MSNIVKYTISGGVPHYRVSLTPSSIPSNYHSKTGEYQFTGVTNGSYTLTAIDGNNCTFVQHITVDPNIPTTTTQPLNSQLITIGNTFNPQNIFDETKTNINTKYVGSPDPLNVLLYLWFKTSDGKPLTSQLSMNYIFIANPSTNGTRFTFLGASDQIHTTVTSNSRAVYMLQGTITMKVGFIESYYSYNLKKGTTTTDYDLSLDSTKLIFNTDLITTVVPPMLYGINSISPTLIKMNFA